MKNVELNINIKIFKYKKWLLPYGEWGSKKIIFLIHLSSPSHPPFPILFNLTYQFFMKKSYC
jgi:hypothetical protein